MKFVAVAAGAVVALVFAGLAVVVLVVSAATGANGLPATETAQMDIPAEMLSVYQQAAEQTCGMPWQVLAAIGKIESDHGRSNLLGVKVGENSAGAAGPMQFMSATWAVFGVDGNGDGQRNLYDPVDAIWGAANYLCSNGAGDPAQLRNAIFRYNHAAWYVDEVLTVAASYAGLSSGGSGPYTLPVERAVFDSNPDYLTRPHHDYPAIDIPVAVGTPVYAVTDGTILAAADDGGACGGTVILEGNDGNRYTYCHASRVLVSPGQTVAGGNLLLLSGGQPGAPGAGDSTGPHLHFGISVSGIAVCPQGLLAAWMNGDQRGPATAPTSGCTF